jgi:hypothetical protein
MEEVVTATGAGKRKFKTLSSAAADHDNEYQQQPSTPLRRLPSKESVQANDFNKDISPKQSFSLSTASVSLLDEGRHCSTLGDDVPNLGATLSKQPTPKSSSSRSKQLSRILGLENSIRVEVGSDGQKENLDDTTGSGLHLALSSFGTGVCSNQKGRSELLGEFQRKPRLAGMRGTQSRRIGNMARKRRHGLARSVIGEAAASAQSESDQTIVQVMLN